MNSYNKGEWSELYVFLKLLAEGKLYAADENLKPIPDIFYPVLRILRQESATENWEYVRNGRIIILNALTGETIPFEVEQFIYYSNILLDKILKSEGASFYVEEIANFLTAIRVEKIKSKSLNKRDITLIVHDRMTNTTPELGFSIKSNLGRPSTLFNASKGSNFIYRITGTAFTSQEINDINAIDTNSKIMDRIKFILNHGRNLEFHEIEGKTFQANLELIDSYMPKIVASMLLLSYPKTATRISDIINILQIQNPLHFTNTATHPVYRYKIKNLLTDIALGMTSGAIWEGIYDATGGFIIVGKTGEILCYHIYNRNEFQEYLIKNTYMDTPSSTRHQFGEIYEVNGEQYFKLNLQIRFG